MQVKMIGIDHSRASLDLREAFSFTRNEITEALCAIKEEYDINGCILISTCNRTELWVSGESLEISLSDLLCKIKKINKLDYKECFVERENKEAIKHILNVVCGFDSKIFGEDQIITQVKKSLIIARECKTTDMLLEKIFQSALSAGKKVKTEVHFDRNNVNSAKMIVDYLKEKKENLKSLKCLVIGNGQMGQLVAKLLVSEGCDVSMTLRKKFHSKDEIESISVQGCSMISFDERLDEINTYNVVISATLSAHYTIMAEGLKDRLGKHKYYMFDLAVPRDIEPEIGKLENVDLLNIDCMMDSGNYSIDNEKLLYAKEILCECEKELNRWFGYREYVPTIKEISELVAEDAKKRFLGSHASDEIDLNNSAPVVKEAVRMATNKVIYGLKDTLPPKMWKECIEGIYGAASKDTIKH